jgi:hypothetical protein
MTVNGRAIYESQQRFVFLLLRQKYYHFNARYIAYFIMPDILIITNYFDESTFPDFINT